MDYWLIKEIKNPEKYNKAIEKICGLYAIASELKEMGIALISTDEKTSIQALERKILPMKKGYCEKLDRARYI